MTDFEKVVKGLECCGANRSCLGCPYINYLNNGCMDKLNADALALICEQQEEAPAWISVNDRLPEEGQVCWVWCKEMDEPEEDWYADERGRMTSCQVGDKLITNVSSGWWNNDIMPITHWMPIPQPKKPEPPKE